MNTSKDQMQLAALLRQIEVSLGWKDASNWPNHLFEELSEAIQSETGTLLSPSTLKRVWGRVNYNGKPSITTLNALAQFAGHRNWHAYTVDQPAEKQQPTLAPKRMSNLGIIVVSAAFLTLVFISLFSMIGPAAEKDVSWDQSPVTFSSRPLAEGIPNSVVFDFNLNQCPSDSIFIQQYWDRTKTIKLASDQKQATGIYYYPGYFRAKLLVDGAIIREHDLFIKSDSWLGTIDYKPIPKYIEHIQADNRIAFPSSVFNEIKLTENPVQASFHLVTSFSDVSADDFSLSTTIKNTYADKWAVCQQVKIVLLGTKGAMVVPFSIPGCTSDLNIMVNDVYLSGKEHNLSSLGTDFHTGRKLSLQIHDKALTVLIDDSPVFQQAYTEPVGRLAGIRFRFMGLIEVEELKMLDGAGDVVYDVKG